MVDVRQTIQEMNRIRTNQEELYNDMNRFTVQVILTYLHNSPMNVDEVHDLQKHLTADITRDEIIKLLNDLVKSGYAEKSGMRSYIHTPESVSVLEHEGLTKEIFNI